MSAIIINPKTKEEQKFLTRLLKKLNIDANVMDEPSPNYETQKAMEDVKKNKGKRVKNAKALFTELGI